MALKMVAYLGLYQYAGSEEDMVMLLGIASRLQRVERPAYDQPYRPTAKQERLCTSISLEEVLPDPDPDSAAEPQATDEEIQF